MDFLVDFLFSILLEAPLEAVMESKIKCRIKTVLMTVLAGLIVGFLIFICVQSNSVLGWIVTAATAALFGWGIVYGHRKGWSDRT